jgi:hypothetical protein
MTDYKTLFVAIAAKVVRGLPAPTGVSIHADGHVYLTLERLASDSDADEATVLAHVADEHDGPVDGCECEDCEDERERLQEVAASSG